MSYYVGRSPLVHQSVYSKSGSFWFTSIDDPAGVLSNMSGLGVAAGGKPWKSTEALYQACRFPDYPDVQEEIRAKASPMGAKFASKPHRRDKCRADWEDVQIPIMEWCLWLKLAFNFRFVYWALRNNISKPIVEISSKRDQFWGTKPDKANPDQVTGQNVLGKLWMAIREDLLDDPQISFEALSQKYATVPPPPLGNFKLFGQAVERIQAQTPAIR